MAHDAQQVDVGCVVWSGALDGATDGQVGDMTHDPLCPRPLCDYGQPDGDCTGYEDCVHDCQCSLIAKVRADEREQAAQRATEFYFHDGDCIAVIVRDHSQCNCPHSEMLKAIRGEA